MQSALVRRSRRRNAHRLFLRILPKSFFAVTEELDHQVREALRHRRRSRIVPIVLIVFAISAGVCAYLWVTYGDDFRTAVFATPTVAAAPAGKEQPVTRADFDRSERQTVDSLQSMAKGLEAQKADLKGLSDMVADLAAKVDALRNAAAASAQPAIVPPPPAVVAPRKKPQGPKKPGPISVGGAPLPPAPAPDR
jgi:hypothetical protein